MVTYYLARSWQGEEVLHPTIISLVIFVAKRRILVIINGEMTVVVVRNRGHRWIIGRVIGRVSVQGFESLLTIGWG